MEERQGGVVPVGEHRPGQPEVQHQRRDSLGWQGAPGSLFGRVPIPLQPTLRHEVDPSASPDGGGDDSGYAPAVARHPLDAQSDLDGDFLGLGQQTIMAETSQTVPLPKSPVASIEAEV